MQLILTTICAFALINWAAAKWLRRTGEGSARSTSLLHHLLEELRAFVIVTGALIAVLLLVFVYTRIFGPIRPIHEWGN